MVVKTGDAGNNTIGGTAGADTLRGLAGNDILRGRAGNDVLDGGSGGDQLFGNEGNDDLFGRAGNDVLKGGTGNDDLEGGQGRDQLYGGDGADDFTFLLGSGRDEIFDFQDDVDTILIDRDFGFTSVQQVLNFASSSGGDSAIDLSKTGADSPRIILYGVDNFNDLADDIVLI